MSDANDDAKQAQLERAQQRWQLVVHDEGRREVLDALRRIARFKRFEFEGLKARLPGPVRRGARIDLEPMRDALREAGVRCDLEERPPQGSQT